MRTSRSGSAGHSASQPPQSIEAVRRRARHRLIGAVILVLVGVLGFPLLFDTQPRPIAVDIPIEIPSRNGSPLPATAKPAPVNSAKTATTTETPSRKDEVTPDKQVSPAAVLAKETAGKDQAATTTPSDEKRDEAAAPPVADKPVAKTAVRLPEKPLDKAPVKAESNTDVKPDAKAGTKDMSAGEERIVVQVGAFAEAARARDVRLKLERAGLKTYTHVADTPQGKRIRVRLGPFASKAEAEKAAAKAKSLGLQTTLLWL